MAIENSSLVKDIVTLSFYLSLVNSATLAVLFSVTAIKRLSSLTMRTTRRIYQIKIANTSLRGRVVMLGRSLITLYRCY